MRTLFVVLAALLATQTVSTDTVLVHVRAMDSKKVPALGLKAENFQIWEDGVEQKVSFFSSADGAWNINFILLGPGAANHNGRVSASVATAGKIAAAFTAFRKAGNPQNKYQSDELPDSASGNRELLAAIDRNLDELKRSTSPKRALVVVTAGFEDVFISPKRIEDANIPIYVVFISTPRLGSGDTSGPPGQYTSATKGSVLVEMASKTRGDYFSVAPEKLESQLLQLAAELKNEYVIGFKTTNGTKDGGWRKLKMKVTSPSGLNLSANFKEKYFTQKP